MVSLETASSLYHASFVTQLAISQYVDLNRRRNTTSMYTLARSTTRQRAISPAVKESSQKKNQKPLSDHATHRADHPLHRSLDDVLVSHIHASSLL
jgi:cation transport regulator ChaB